VRSVPATWGAETVVAVMANSLPRGYQTNFSSSTEQMAMVRLDVLAALKRCTAEHSGAVDLEASAFVDQSVPGPLAYHTAVLEVVNECRLG
jgi:hypothetical protein